MTCNKCGRDISELKDYARPHLCRECYNRRVQEWRYGGEVPPTYTRMCQHREIICIHDRATREKIA